MICSQCIGRGTLFFMRGGNRLWMKCAWCKGTGVFTCECLTNDPHKFFGPATIVMSNKVKGCKEPLTWEQIQEIDGTDHKPPNQKKR